MRRYAAEHGVGITTFDCASELEKIARGYPSFKCVLRIRCDDASAKINLGLKYGADLCDVPMLLGMAQDLGLQVCRVWGVSRPVRGAGNDRDRCGAHGALFPGLPRCPVLGFVQLHMCAGAAWSGLAAREG